MRQLNSLAGDLEKFIDGISKPWALLILQTAFAAVVAHFLPLKLAL